MVTPQPTVEMQTSEALEWISWLWRSSRDGASPSQFCWWLQFTWCIALVSEISAALWERAGCLKLRFPSRTFRPCAVATPFARRSGRTLSPPRLWGGCPCSPHPPAATSLGGSLFFCRREKGPRLYAWVIMDTPFNAVVQSEQLHFPDGEPPKCPLPLNCSFLWKLGFTSAPERQSGSNHTFRDPMETEFSSRSQGVSAALWGCSASGETLSGKPSVSGHGSSSAHFGNARTQRKSIHLRRLHLL